MKNRDQTHCPFGNPFSKSMGEETGGTNPVFCGRRLSVTDETLKTTEQTKIPISPFLSAMMKPANKSEMEEHTNAGNSNKVTCQAVQESDCR